MEAFWYSTTKKIRVQKSAGNTLASFFWDRDGIFLKILYWAANWISQGVLFLQGNPPVHKTLITLLKISEIGLPLTLFSRFSTVRLLLIPKTSIPLRSGCIPKQRICLEGLGFLYEPCEPWVKCVNIKKRLCWINKITTKTYNKKHELFNTLKQACDNEVN